MNLPNCLHRVATIFGALTVLQITGPVWAVDSQPFSAELIAVFVGKDHEAGLLALDGHATLMGQVSGVVSHETRGPRELGIFFIENDEGDRLSCSYEIATDTGLGSYEVYDGDGLFLGATGGGTVMIDDPLPDGSYRLTLEGTIVLSSPFSAAVIAVSAGHDREALLFSFEGEASHLGPVTGTTRHEVKGSRELGEFVMEGSDGDSLIGRYEFRFDPVLAVGTYTIVGGTGQFEGATGGGVIYVDETHLPGTPFPVEFEGTISF